ncbi:hypothetical protein CE91St41_01620 [Oscillospiraceae bacterium]|nr:hypothetical protein CE91St40_01620 [Oscillospiraceae bacterium]BDF73273.1 hypothetical protein CE91St41_01620 [Oscillospiraceae bacterium]
MEHGLLILVILVIYLLFMLFLGFYFKSRVNTFSDFILGARGLPWFVIAMTMLATLANAQQTLGIAGTSYNTGLSAMIWFFLLVNVFIYPILIRLGSRYRYLNFSTIVDLGEARFPNSARMTILLSVWQVAWGIVSTAICIFGGALVIETIFDVPMEVATVIVAVITVVYCVMGGLNGVVFTDLIQWLIIIAGTAFLVPAVFIKYGSFTGFFSNLLGTTGMEPVAGTTLWAGFTDLFTLAPGVTVLGLIAMGIAGSLWIPIDLGFMQRMLAAKTLKDGRKACMGFVVIVTLWASIMVIMGLYAQALFPGVLNTDTVIILMADAALPALGTAIFVTAIAAAVMSTVSTYLNAASAILTKNIYKRFIRKDADDRQMIRVARICVVLVAVAAMAFAPMIRGGGVFATAITAQMVMCASLTPLILLATYWRRMSEKAAFWGCIVSGVVTLGLIINAGGGSAVFNGAGIGGIPAVFIGLAISLVIYIGISLATPYDRSKVGPDFLALFESKEKADKTSNKDILVIGIGVAVVLIAILVRKFGGGAPTSWPPLGGFGAVLTNGFFLLAGVAILIICIYILIRSVKWVRSLKKGDAPEEEPTEPSKKA